MAADTCQVARLRLIVAIALVALLAGAAAGISSAVGAHAQGRARSHKPRCLKTVKVHSRGVYVLRHRAVACRRRSVRHTGRVKHRRPAHARRHARTAPRRATRRHGTPRHSASRLRAGRRTSAADVNGQCSDTQLTPTEANLDRIRTAMLCLVNRERAVHGETALAASTAIERAAQGHTESMAFGDYFNHVGPGGDTPVDRLRSAGYLSGAGGYEVGENIAWGTLWLSSPRAIVAAWMASPPHRANILDARFRDTAIGASPHPPAALSHGQAGGLYTQDFGVIITG
ncbi:MAG: SCP-like extracellular [Solirubrobacterales bacterium]|nr:SCP-like extracellular [Solirubrobacterales bacterium]